MYYLVAIAGRLAGQRFPIDADGLGIGRVPDGNQVVLPAADISRSHARLLPSADGRLRLRDTSINGTFVNERRVATEAEVRPGDSLRFGADAGEVFVVAGERDAAAPAALSPAAEPAAAAAARAPLRTIRVEAGEAPAPNWLQLVVDQYSVKTVAIPPPRLEIGRTPGTGRLVIPHPTVSTQHAEILTGGAGGGATLRDLNSTNGTFVNDERVGEKRLEDGDLIRFGSCDSHLLLFRQAQRRPERLKEMNLAQPCVTLGRAEQNTFRLDHPTVSLFHAEIRNQNRVYTIADKGSTNGTFVNGLRLAKPQPLQPGDRVSLGAYQFVFDGSHFEGQAETGRTSLTAAHLRVEVKSITGGGNKVLLDDVSLAIEPCQFVGLLGGSGAGKSTLMDALNGARPAQRGQVWLNRSELYRDFSALRSLIGYVPQDDILHLELTPLECLYYSARLRLPDDYGDAALRQRVREVLTVLELTAQAEQPIRSLSGGQRKRVSVGIELLSNPSILFLDEPTAGQDPKNELQMMQLFRRLANRGASVILNTHLLGSFGLLDRTAVLVGGRLAFYGPAQEMPGYFECEHPNEIYFRLKDQHTPEEWGARFKASPQYERHIAPALAATAPATLPGAAALDPAPEGPRHSPVRQLRTLLHRQCAIKLKDKASLAVLILPPSLIALLVGIMNLPGPNPQTGRVTYSPNSPMSLFITVLVALWFGCSSTVREIVDEAAIFRRERQRDLTLTGYLGAKLFYLLGLAGLQSALFILAMASLHVLINHLAAAWGLMWLLMLQGGLIGFLISAIADTAEKALYAFPLVMIAELLFAGMLMPTVHLHPFYARASSAANGQVRQLELFDQPAWLPTAQPMAAPLRDSVAMLMVSRWSLESLASEYAQDYARLPECLQEQEGAASGYNCGYSVGLLDTVALTFHPRQAADARAYLEAMARTVASQGTAPLPSPDVPPALPAYLAVQAAFAAGMIGLLVLAMKRKEGGGSHGR